MSDGILVRGRRVGMTIVAAMVGLIGAVIPAAPAAATGTPAQVVAWGLNQVGQGDVPAGLSDVTAISNGYTYTLALKSDGTVLAWGSDYTRGGGQSHVPPGLADVTAISAGTTHNLALKSDGTVVAWGANDQGESDVPAGLANVIAVSAGSGFSLALKSDGTVVSWGYPFGGSTETPMPAGLSDVVAIAAGGSEAAALRSDGTVVTWGADYAGQLGPPAGLDHVVAIAAASDNFLALKSDGTVVAWGVDHGGNTQVPAGLGNVRAIAAGGDHNLALTADGRVVAWGSNTDGQTDVPAGLTQVTAIAAGLYASYALETGVTAPTTTIACNGAPCGFWSGVNPVNVSLSAFGPDGSPVAATTTYTLDGSDPATSPTAKTYTGPFTLTSTALVRRFSVDQAGNVEITRSRLLYIDLIPPTTTAYCNGTTQCSGWFHGPVGVMLLSQDTGGSGTNVTVYTTDGSDPTTSPTAVTTTSASFTARQTTTVRYYSIDNAGNAEPVKTQLIQIDTTPPTTLIQCNGGPCGSSYPGPVTVSLTATDTGGSGVAKTMYTTDGSDPATSATARTYTGPFGVSQTTTVKYYSLDVAGNAEPVQTTSVQIGAAAYTTLVDGRPSLLAHWRLGEKSGTTAWDTTGRYNGTYTGSPTLGVPGAVTNDPDTAAGFNGSTSKVSVPALPAVGDFTVEGWSYLTSSSTTNNTVFGAANSVRILARPGSPSTPTAAYAGVWLNGTEYVLQPKSTASNLNTWVHWVLTRQGNVLTLYRNGVQTGQRTDLPATATASLNGAIGMQSNGNYPLTGRIDEVALYSSALSAADVAADYQAALNGPPPPPPSTPSYKSAVLGEPSLISYWRLGEGSGTTAADSKGTNNGTYSSVSLGAPGAITNDPDTAAAFNGSTSKVSLPSLGTAGDFTIEGWTYLTSSSTTNNTLYGAGGAVRLLIRPGSATAAYAGVWLNGTEYVLQPSSPASNINTWVYWALTRHGNVLTLYRNGVQIGQRTDLPATATATISGSIGAQGGSTYFLTGRIDEVAVYSSALGSAAITGHYNAALNGPPPQ